MKYEDFSNMQFGEWKVLYRSNNKWMCECSCGVKKEVQSQHLKSGASKYCIACASKKKWDKRKPDTSNSILGRLYSQILWNAKKRDIPVIDLNKENLYELLIKQQFKCALSGISISIAETRENHGNGDTTASLDRIDSTKSYSLDNVWWVHKDINLMKNDFSKSKFIDYCHLISRNNNG